MYWKGEEFIQGIERKVTRNVQAACIHVKSRARENISTPSRTVTYVQGVNIRTGERGKIKKKLGKRGSSRSKPGDFPHKDYGTLRASVAHMMIADQPKGLVGSSLSYALFLERGTTKMSARPWLRRTLAEESEAVLSIVTTDLTPT